MSVTDKILQIREVSHEYRKSENPLELACSDVVSLSHHVDTLRKKLGELKAQLKDANETIDFYAHNDEIFGSHNFDISCGACTEKPLGKRAREYKAKYGGSDEIK